jgi:type II secretory pathway pseudopilin PulG
MSFSKSQRAFSILKTLMIVGLLVIIGMLLFPAVMSWTYYNDRVSQVKSDVAQIATALNAYLSEYGKLPTPQLRNANSAKLMNTLAGTMPNDPDNPKKIVFLEVPKAKNHRNGAEGVGEHGGYLSGFKDPWGSFYEIRIDPVGTSVEGPDGTVHKPVIVWSRGDPAKMGSYDDKNEWVKSWE